MPDHGDTTIVGGEGQSRPRATPTTIERGEQVGRYVVLEQLGRGGMGVVYAAYDPELDRKVALKLLHAQLHAGVDTSEGRPRLLREAQALAKLAHPNVITIHDVGTVAGAVFIAMEFIEGQTLGDWSERARPWRERVAMFVAAGRGIAAAHRAGIVHRDFKPDNVMIGKDGRPRVLDFGLARAADVGEIRGEPIERSSEGALDPVLLSSSTLDTKLTATGTVMGTPAYMAPEQHYGLAVDERSDQFSFCVATYEALYGERPFAGDNLAALAFAVTEGKVREAPAGSAVPGWLRKLLLRGLAVDPAARHPSMDELLRALDRDPTRTRRAVLLGVGLVAALVGLALAGQRWLAGPQLCTGAEQHLVGVWDLDTRAALHEAFVASGAVYAEASFAGFAAALDDYAEQWTTMHGQACAATRIHGEQSDEVLTLRMTCLDRSRAQLSALVEVYRSADAQAVERSVEAADSLPPLRLCADVEALTLGVRPPETEALRVRVDELRGRVDVARTLGRSGRIVEAHAQLSALMPEVDATDYRPLVAEAELARAGASELPEERIAALERAVWMAEVSHHDRVAAEAWVQLVEARGTGANEFVRALDAVARADAAIERIAGDPELRIRLDVAHGMVLNSMDRDAEALVLQRRAHAARIAAGQGGTPIALSEVVALANILLDHDELDEAEQVLNEAIGHARPLLGDDHPWLARLQATRGRVFYEQSNYVAAEADLRAALVVLERSVGEGSPQVGGVLNGLAVLLDEQRRFDEAAPLFERAAANYRASLGPRHAEVAKVLHNLGLLQLEIGDTEQAIINLEEAKAIRYELFGTRSAQVGWIEDAVCRGLHALGREQEAITHCVAGLEVIAALELGDASPAIALSTSLALAELGSGDREAARRTLEANQARVDSVGAQTLGYPIAGRQEFEYAKLLALLGEHDEARRLAELAAEHYALASEYYQPTRDAIRAWLAEQP